jgi:4-hydroxybenzoate polyprenyltransferase
MAGPGQPLPGPARRGQGTAWVRLLRLPLFLTVAGDLAAGAALGGEVPALLLAALFPLSAALHLAGMVLNDLVDRREDRRTRPDRPLAAGDLTPRAARLALAGLFALGLGGAWAFPFPRPVPICLTALALAVLLYNLGPRRLAWWGPLLLGLCRGLDVAAAGLLAPAAAGPALAAGSLLFALYGALVTWQAAGEEERGLASLRPLLPLLPLPGVLALVPAGGFPWALLPLALLGADCLAGYRRGRGVRGARGVTGAWIGGFLLLGAALSLGSGRWGEGAVCLACWLVVRGITPGANRS